MYGTRAAKARRFSLLLLEDEEEYVQVGDGVGRGGMGLAESGVRRRVRRGWIDETAGKETVRRGGRTR